MKISLEYSDGTNRYFVVSDNLDKKVNAGEKIKIITQHPEFSETFIVTTKPKKTKED